MNITMIGLEKMGANMATHLMHGGHHVVTLDLNDGAIQKTNQKKHARWTI